VFLPGAHQQFDVPGPPARQARIQFRSAREGGAFTLSIKGEATADLAKTKFKESGYSFGIDWAVFKGRAAERCRHPTDANTISCRFCRSPDHSLAFEGEFDFP
jgi:hypothetical protein